MSAVKCVSSRPRVHPRARLLVILTRSIVLGDPRAFSAARCEAAALRELGALVACEQMCAVELVL